MQQSDWKVASFGDCADFQEGYVNPAQSVASYFDGPISWLRAVDLNDGFVTATSRTLSKEGFRSAGKSATMFPAGSLAISKSGTIGRIGILQREMCGNRAVINVKPRSDCLDLRFAFYTMLLGRPEIERLAEGSVQKNLYVSALSKFKFVLPPLPEQRAIAATLGALDDKIELNRKMNATLEAMARALFRDWFVNFGPTRAKMEARAPYLSPDLWSLFPDRLDDEGKPEGWEEKGLLDLATLISGGTPKTDKAEYWNGDIPWASAKDVSQCKDAFLIKTERSISESGLKNSATKIIPKHATVVVARGATTGRSCMFGSDIAMNQTCYALTSRSDHAFWLNCAFHELVDRLVNAAHGSVFDTITTRTIEAVTLVQGPKELRDQFEHMVSSLFQRLLTNVIESRTLAETRDLLLPRLMSGELRVAEAERLAREVA